MFELLYLGIAAITIVYVAHLAKKHVADFDPKMVNFARNLLVGGLLAFAFLSNLHLLSANHASPQVDVPEISIPPVEVAPVTPIREEQLDDQKKAIEDLQDFRKGILKDEAQK